MSGKDGANARDIEREGEADGVGVTCVEGIRVGAVTEVRTGCKHEGLEGENKHAET